MSNWKKVEGFPRYSVSDEGVVRNDKRGNILSPIALTRGYKGYRLYINNKKAVTVKAHRVVAKAWVPNPGDKPQVNHIDGNKWHNHPKNLEWVTNRENFDHAESLGLNKHVPKCIDSFDRVMYFHNFGYSTRVITNMTGMTKSTVQRMVKYPEKYK